MTPIKVLVVDDSVVIRKLVTDLLSSDPDLEVVGTAVNGLAAQSKVELLKPDLVTMDIEMPTMDGIEAVRTLRASGSKVPIIMFSTLTERGATATLDALAAGATDYVAKPANVGSVGQSMQQVRDALIPRIKALVPGHRVPPARPASTSVAAPEPSARRSGPVGLRSPSAGPPAGHRLLVVGSSTGGPAALTTFLTGLPLLPVPIAVVQHMPPVFTRQFATRLDRSLPATVREVEHGDVLRPGTVSIAPGDYHLSVKKRGSDLVAHLSQGAPENYCRPAVDVLFRSAAEVLGNQVLAVVLTGMGQDGCRGARNLVDAGSSVLVQDESTSVVWGMPGAIAHAGLAEAVLPLPQLAPELARRLVRGATPAQRHTAGASR